MHCKIDVYINRYRLLGDSKVIWQIASSPSLPMEGAFRNSAILSAAECIGG